MDRFLWMYFNRHLERYCYENRKPRKKYKTQTKNMLTSYELKDVRPNLQYNNTIESKFRIDNFLKSVNGYISLNSIDSESKVFGNC